jgi:hypothetical protein
MKQMTNWLDKINNAKKMVIKLKRKADTKLEKAKLKRVQAKATEIKGLDKRLKELKKQEVTASKREEIYKLEKKLTTSGKILTVLEKGAKVTIQQGGKLAKGYGKSLNKTGTRKGKKRR